MLSLAFAVLCAKTYWVLFLADKGVLSFVYFGKWLFTIVCEIYFMYLFAYRHKQIKATTETLKIRGTYTIEEVGNKKWKCRHPRKLITVLFVATILACFMSPMGGSGVQSWSPKKLVLHSSKMLSYKLFIWSPDDFKENSTKTRELTRDYGTHLTPLTVIMGISEIGMRFCSKMKMDTAQNVGAVVAVLIWLRNRYFGKKLKRIDFKNYNDGDDNDELDSSNGLYAEFMEVKEENMLTNRLTGGLLMIVHVHNLLQCATFLMRCLDGNATLTQFAFLIYSLSKVALIYSFGTRAEAEV